MTASSNDRLVSDAAMSSAAAALGNLARRVRQPRADLTVGQVDVIRFLSISGDEDPEGFLLDVGFFGFEAAFEEGDELGMPDGLQTAEMRRSEKVGMLRDKFVDGVREDGAGIADELFEQFCLRFDGFGFELLEERGLSGREA